MQIVWPQVLCWHLCRKSTLLSPQTREAVRGVRQKVWDVLKSCSYIITFSTLQKLVLLANKSNSCIPCFGNIKPLSTAPSSSFGSNQLSPQLGQPGLQYSKVRLCCLVSLSAGHLGSQTGRYCLLCISVMLLGMKRLTSASISAIFSSIVGMALLGRCSWTLV